MFKHSFQLRASATAGLLALLTACGGGGNSVVVDAAPTTPPPTTTNPPGSTAPTAAQQSSFVADYGNGVAMLNSYGGLTSTAFVDLFDDAFLDAGYDKTQVRNNLQQEAIALTTSPDLSAFPQVKLSGMTIGNCDAANVCTLTATATNTDADSTAVPFTTRVRLQNGKFRLYGDQTAATAA